jgi:hypothetical protein
VAAGYALFLTAGPDTLYAAMIPTLFLVGLSFALAYGPITIAATDGVDESEQGLAGGLLNTAFQFGAAFGISAVTAVQVAALGAGTGLSTAAGYDSIRTALLVPVVAASLGAVVIAFGLRARRRTATPPAATSQTAEEMTGATR